MARLAPHWGTQARTWDELGEDTPGQWCQHLVTAVVEDLIRAGVVAPVSRDALAHLSRDWDALAASIELDHLSGAWIGMDPRSLRYCAGRLRALLGIPPGN